MGVSVNQPLLGVGQTWQNVGQFGGRAAATNYTNTTGGTIFAFLHVAGSNPWTFTVQGLGLTVYEPTTNAGNAFFVIPNGATYRADGGVVNAWYELRK